MLPDRKLRIGFGILLITLTLLSLCFVPDKTVHYWIGILIGGIVGGGTVVYMMLNNAIDPEQAKNSYIKRVNSPWIIISVVGGSLLGRVIIQKLSSTDFDVLFLSFLLTWIFLVIGYILLKTWQASE